MIFQNPRGCRALKGSNNYIPPFYISNDRQGAEHYLENDDQTDAYEGLAFQGQLQEPPKLSLRAVAFASEFVRLDKPLLFSSPCY